MLSYVICVLMLISVVVAVFLGTGESLLAGTLSGAQDAVELCMRLVGTMALWSGLFRIAQKAGILRILSRLLRPITRLLFPDVHHEETLSLMTTNMVSNMVGIGNAATPAGMAAMKQMGKYSHGTPTAAMAVFCVLNGASIQLIPTTIISMRADAGAAMPADIIVCVWVTSMIAAVFGIALVKVLGRRI